MNANSIQLRPHVEIHGRYSIEWSYHFPLQPGLIIESQFDISFGGEKVSGAARSSLSQSNIANTRLSFADSAASIRIQSLRFYKDSLWLLEAIQSEWEGKDLRYVNVSNSEKSFVHIVKEQWTPSFFGKLGIILQSDLKSIKRQLRNSVKDKKAFQNRDLQRYRNCKSSLLSSFRAALRLIQARFVWERLLQLEKSTLIFPSDETDLNLSVKFYQRVCDLSELALSLVANTVAQLQTIYADAHRASSEHISQMLKTSWDPSGGEANLEIIELEEERFLKSEKRWLSSWARTCNELRIRSHLPSFSEIANNDRLASGYFDRIRTLKKQHYQVFDLDVSLKPNDKKIDFRIGAFAAGVSAFFAFLSLIFLNLGQVSFESRSVITLAVFLLGNTLIYIAKDRLKEWLKLNLKNFLHLRSGMWTGVCSLHSEPDNSDPKKRVEISKMERETWWSQDMENWKFHVWEEFSIVPNCESSGARIVKQVWRLPLDEILHTLDNARHNLKLPGLDGEPREVPVLKQGEFPFQLRVRVKKKSNGNEVELDTATSAGHIQTAGDSIVQVVDYS